MLNETLELVFETVSRRSHFTIIDYAIFVLLIVCSLSIGIYIGFKSWSSATTKDFLVGGRQMHPIPVAMSLIGGVISALSVLGNATEMYLHGTQLSLNIIGCFYGTIIIMFIILPILYPLELISLMQYLTLRYKSQTLKKMGSLVQIFASCMYLGMCLYAPSLALTSVTSLSSWSAIVLLGVVCVIYITLGGVKAVIYTDVLQTSLMFVGIAVVIIIASIDIGGVGKVFDIAEAGGRIEFFNFDFNPLTRHTFWSVQVLGTYFIISAVGISQAQFMRLSSVKSLKASQSLCVIFFIGLAMLWSLFYFTGIVAYATYADCDPLTTGEIQKADQIVPFLVADKLSHLPGMSGLFVSAVYGAVLSSVSSSASAISALIWEDFLSEWKWFNRNVKISPINVTRSLSAAAGFVGIGLAFLIGQLGTLFQAAYSFFGAFVSPLDGLFVTSILAPWVTEKGAICGFLSALTFNMWLLAGKIINGAGKSTPLPLDISGCPSNQTFESVFNTTLQPEILSINELSTLSPNLIYNVDDAQNERDYLAMYDISYCFYGAIGIFIVFTVSSIVSLVTGPTDAYSIDERLVNKSSLRLYKKLWDKFGAHKDLSVNNNMDSISSQHNMINNDIKKQNLEMKSLRKF